MPDSIHISQLELQAHLGVPDVEQVHPQRLTLSLTLHPAWPFIDLEDLIDNTIDYAAVCEAVKALVAERPRKLLETLADEIARGVLEQFPACAAVDVELRKFILHDTAYVAVRLTRPLSS